MTQNTDYNTIDAADFGRGLRGLGINLLCRDVAGMVRFLRDVLGLSVYRESADYAIIAHDGMVFQIHSDASFHANQVLGLVPDNPPRGGGAQFYLFGLDPDAVVARSDPATVIERPTDKPHGLREATLLAPEGYAFTPARPA
ncbi:glyoxalase [Roseibaca sp. Y0-43]|uniref:glyoxalase n=1 Tax=Roseibaca sp. Y0-43 TaxID=2816854 RepID=UPI001D0C097C|nr:glyoxalase [Roseibaca sp. Y0-43]MCC1482619.1 glyoxalase [Roseibaca sp. Y0-43]